jgi:hypothetical protein
MTEKELEYKIGVADKAAIYNVLINECTIFLGSINVFNQT